MSYLRLHLPAVAAVALLAAFISLANAARAYECSESDTSPAAVFECVNAVRTDPQYWSQFASCDFSDLQAVGPLVEDDKLTFAADIQAQAMAEARSISHDNFVFRVRTAAGFEGNRISENVAAGQTSALMVVLGWMCSSGHQANIMDCQVDKVGTAVDCGNGGLYSCYFAQIFGCDSGPCSCFSNSIPPPPPPESEAPPPTTAQAPSAPPPSPAQKTSTTPPSPSKGPELPKTPGIPQDEGFQENEADPPLNKEAENSLGCSESDTSSAAVFECMNAVRMDPQYWSQFARCDFNDLQAIGPLVQDDRLTHAADIHVQAMAAAGSLNHDNFVYRVRTAAGFDGNRISENVAAGQTSARMVVLGWMCSSGHQTNIMDCKVDKVGTAVDCGNGGAHSCYFAQIFGCDSGSCSCFSNSTPPPPPPERNPPPLSASQGNSTEPPSPKAPQIPKTPEASRGAESQESIGAPPPKEEVDNSSNDMSEPDGGSPLNMTQSQIDIIVGHIIRTTTTSSLREQFMGVENGTSSAGSGRK